MVTLMHIVFHCGEQLDKSVQTQSLVFPYSLLSDPKELGQFPKIGETPQLSQLRSTSQRSPCSYFLKFSFYLQPS